MTSTQAQSLCTFYVESMLLGIDVRDVQEAIRQQNLTTVPLAKSAIKGLINLRGQIVTAIDLRQRLGLSARADDRQMMNVVVRSDGEVISLLVDDIGEVLEIHDVDFEPLPETANASLRLMASGAYKLQNRLLLRLDLQKILNITVETYA